MHKICSYKRFVYVKNSIFSMVCNQKFDDNADGTITGDFFTLLRLTKQSVLFSFFFISSKCLLIFATRK